MRSKREQMVDEIREKYGLNSSDVLSVMLQVPRHKFVPKENQDLAYRDGPVLIGFGQTMSQPYTVAVMTKLITETLNSKYETRNKSKFIKSKIPKKTNKYGKVLEIGTGSGYQAAVLSKFYNEVYTIEIISELAKKAARTINKLGYDNVYVKTGSGEWGWKEHAPYDAIMVTAGVEKVPNELFDQLKVGGLLVAPVGKGNDKVMTRITKLKNRGTKKPRNKIIKKLKHKVIKLPSNQVTKMFKEEKFGTFRFVPFVEERN